jgi:hypothetical protein
MNVRVEVIRVGDSSQQCSVYFSTAKISGIASAGADDYVAVKDKEVVFLAGETLQAVDVKLVNSCDRAAMLRYKKLHRRMWQKELLRSKGQVNHSARQIQIQEFTSNSHTRWKRQPRRGVRELPALSCARAPLGDPAMCLGACALLVAS